MYKYTSKRKPLVHAIIPRYPIAKYQPGLNELTNMSFLEQKKLGKMFKISQFVSNCIERDNFVATCILCIKFAELISFVVKNPQSRGFNSFHNKFNKTLQWSKKLKRDLNISKVVKKFTN